MTAFRVDVPVNRITSRPELRLDGEWQYLVDPRPAEQELTEEAVDLTRQFPGRIAVPGCWQGQTGAAAARAFRFNPHRDRVWYRRRFRMPAAWADGRIALRLGGVLPAAEVWLNGVRIGATVSSRSPMRVEVTKAARPGEENDLAIKIFRPAVCLDGVFEWIVGGWEGIYRSVNLEAHASCWVSDLFVDADAEKDTGVVQLQISGVASPQTEVRLALFAPDGKASGRETIAVRVSPSRASQEEERGASLLRIPIPTRRLPRWSPASPALCRAVAEVRVKGAVCDRVEIRFGIRTLRVKGRRILLNGAPITLRIAGDNHIYPATISPPADVDFFRKRLRLIKSYGFNMVAAYDLFTEEYLQAADETGVLVMQTLPFGMVPPLRNERNAPRPAFRRLWRRELDHMVKAQRGHAALGCVSMSGELYVGGQNRTSFRLFNQELPRQTRRLAPHILVMDVNECGATTLDTPHGRRDTDLDEILYCRDALRYTPPPGTDRPALAHEYAWWSSYPDITTIKRYRGLPMEPHWLAEAGIAARRGGLLAELPRFVRNSRALQARLRKEGYEKARLAGLAGYIQWLFFDGLWAVEGIVDDFGNPHNVAPAELRQYNDDAIVLWDDRNRRTCLAGERFPLRMAVAVEGAEPRTGLRLETRLARNGRSWHTETWAVPRLKPAEVSCLCERRLTLPHILRPTAMTLHARLTHPQAGRIAQNRWDAWVFPKVAAFRAGDGINLTGRVTPEIRRFFGARREANPRLLVACDRLGDEELRWLERGGRVLLLSDGALPYYEMPDTDIFRTVPWNRGWTGHSGTVIERHPALGDLPHAGFCDYAFVNLVIGGWPAERTWPFNLDVWRRLTPVQPIIRLIDHYRAARHKAYLFEVGVGRGKLLATCLRFRWGLRHDTPEARYLLRRLTEYALSGRFLPECHVGVRDLRRMVEGRLKWER